MKRTMALSFVVILVIAGLFAAGCGGKSTASSAPTAPATVTVKKVQAGDIQVGYKIYGKGYPLVLIMGYSGTMDIWDPNFVAALARKYKVVMFDNRGVGDTSAGTAQFTIPQFADDTAAFMDALGIKTAHVLGFSMGTYIAQELVLRHPQKVNRLILYAADCGGPQTVPPTPQVMQQLTNTSGTPAERGERLTALLFPPDKAEEVKLSAANIDSKNAGGAALQKNQAYIKATLGKSTEPIPPESVNKQTQAMATWSGTYDQLPNIKSLTLLMTGTQDILTPPQNSLIMVNRIPQAWLAQFRGGGHGLEFQFPQQAANTVLNFLVAP